MIIKDYYKILGFESNKVHIEEIKNAYRDLAKNTIQTSTAIIQKQKKDLKT